MSAFEQRIQLQDKIESFQNASGVILTIYNTMAAIAMAMIAALCFGFDLNTVFISASGIIVSVSFAIGDSIINVVQSLVFILIRRPYELGDLVQWDGKWFYVKR